MSTSVHRVQKTVSEPLELELSVVMSLLAQLGTNCTLLQEWQTPSQLSSPIGLEFLIQGFSPCPGNF